MKLKEYSWHTWVYRFTYYNRWHLPKDLCNYFWCLLIAIIFFIPNFLIRLPMNVINKFDENDYAGDDYLFSVGIYMLITLGCIGIYYWLWVPQYNFIQWIVGNQQDKSYTVWGVVENIILLIILLIVGLVKIKNSIIYEFIKAKYNKYCPKIDWEEDKSI